MSEKNCEPLQKFDEDMIPEDAENGDEVLVDEDIDEALDLGGESIAMADPVPADTKKAVEGVTFRPPRRDAPGPDASEGNDSGKPSEQKSNGKPRRGRSRGGNNRGGRGKRRDDRGNGDSSDAS